LAAAKITKDRAERIARAHACQRCGEYSYKKFVIKEATGSHTKELGVAWQATLVCGVCGLVRATRGTNWPSRLGFAPFGGANDIQIWI
jgi:transcription elongation factor Elf1